MTKINWIKYDPCDKNTHPKEWRWVLVRVEGGEEASGYLRYSQGIPMFGVVGPLYDKKPIEWADILNGNLHSSNSPNRSDLRRSRYKGKRIKGRQCVGVYGCK